MIEHQRKGYPRSLILVFQEVHQMQKENDHSYGAQMPQYNGKDKQIEWADLLSMRIWSTSLPLCNEWHIAVVAIIAFSVIICDAFCKRGGVVHDVPRAVLRIGG